MTPLSILCAGLAVASLIVLSALGRGGKHKPPPCRRCQGSDRAVKQVPDDGRGPMPLMMLIRVECPECEPRGRGWGW